MFASDGAVAVEQALKIAFQYWVNRGEPGAHRFLALGDAYHGDTVGALSVGDGGFGTTRVRPAAVPGGPDPRLRHAPTGRPRRSAAIEAHADTLAAMVIEPLVQGASGILVAEPGGPGPRGAGLPGARGPADLRRGGHRLRADRQAVRLGVGGPGVPARHRSAWARASPAGYLPLSATVASRRGVRGVRRSGPRRRRPSTTATPTAGTPWPARWPCATSSCSTSGTCSATCVEVAEHLGAPARPRRSSGSTGWPRCADGG